MLSDEDKRKWYNQGGILLVKNMETALKEVEGQEAQAMAQLDMQATVQPVATQCSTVNDTRHRRWRSSAVTVATVRLKLLFGCTIPAAPALPALPCGLTLLAALPVSRTGHLTV